MKTYWEIHRKYSNAVFILLLLLDCFLNLTIIIFFYPIKRLRCEK